GGDYTASDESGDAHCFTQRLAERAQAAGVEFRLAVEVDRILAEHGRISGLAVRRAGNAEVLSADAYVLAAGSYSPLLAKSLGLRLPVCPAKVSSATLTLAEGSPAPTVSLT